MTKKIILASQSPRRSEILKKAKYDFVSFPTHVSEIPDKNLNTDQQIIDIASRKAKYCAQVFTSETPDHGLKPIDISRDLILAADTMVCNLDQILGKPESLQMAYDFLKSLSGKTHEVKTAVYLIDLANLEETSLIETTGVTFKTLTDNDIWDYIKTGEPMDRAGAYAIQGLGGKFVSGFVGDYDNVVGLPLHAIEKVFKIKGWTFKRLD
ncbi:MAG: septum formation protein Maf [Bdellovibrio sp.]|nr:septum formation protein Maf [Bdellovibrio sp.]